MQANQDIPRREFLEHLTTLGKVSLVGAAIAPLRAPMARAGVQADDPDAFLGRLTKSVFSQRVGATMLVHPGSALPVAMELVEVGDVPSALDEGEVASGREPFSLLFEAPADTELPQKTYPIEDAALGTFNLFIVPVGPEGVFYEAVFNYSPESQRAFGGEDGVAPVVPLCGAGTGLFLTVGLTALLAGRAAMGTTAERGPSTAVDGEAGSASDAPADG